MYLKMDRRELRLLVERYCHLGLKNQVILDFLKNRHGIPISLSTLKRRLRDYGLKINELWINYKQNLRAYQPVYKYSKSDKRHFHAQYERQNLYSGMWLLLSTLVIRKIVWVNKKKKETWMHFQAGQMHLWDLAELKITWHGMVELPHQFFSSYFWCIFVSQ